MSAQDTTTELPADVRRLVTIRDREIGAINEKFETALNRLRKQYVDRADYDAVRQIDVLLGKESDTPDQAVDPIVGVWYFTWNNKSPVKYEFLEDGTYSGLWPGNRKANRGTWKRDADGDLLLYWEENPGIVWGDVYIYQSNQKARMSARIASKWKMTGERESE